MGARRLLVENLPPTFNEERLHQLCLCHGTVVSVNVVYGADGRSLRFGYVEMGSDIEAERVRKSLNLSLVENARLLVILLEQEHGTTEEKITGYSRVR